MMSVLEIYINWVNSVLGEAGSQVDGVEAVQDGKVLCELIDVLAPDSGLLAKVKASGECTPIAYISAALEHMKNHGIKIKFPAQDIIHNEIKSMLDVLWLLILNYGVHYIGRNAFQRSVGIGKKNLLEWCQEELGATFDPKNTLSFNLCNGRWFKKLLEKMAGCSMTKSEDEAEYIDALLVEIQDRYLIKKDIIKAHDIVDGTVDEHTLMIYLSLLKRRMSYSDRHPRREMLSTDGKAAAMAKVHFFEQRVKSLTSPNSGSPRSKSFDSTMERRGRSLSSGGRSSSANSDGNISRARSRSLFEQNQTGDGNDTSDWSSTGSLFSGKEKSSPTGGMSPIHTKDTSDILHQTISERVIEHLPSASESDLEAKKEAESQRISEKETDTLSEFSSSSLIRERPPLQKGTVEINQNESNSNNESVQVSRRTYSDLDTRRQRSTGVGEKSPLSNGLSNHSNLDPSRSQRHVEESSSLGIGNRESTRQYNVKSHIERISEDKVRIKIKRPKDYILQWEDTIDRLSGVTVTDEPSPRTPLISKYRLDLSSRSKSSETNLMPRKYQDASSTTSTRSRSSEFTSRTEQYSSKIQPHNVSVQYSSGRNLHSTGQRTSPVNDPALDAVLERLPEHMQQRAADASKFLMHNSGPEVLALINAIKQAQETPSTTQSAIPKEAVRPMRTESSSGGSRVRFQTSPQTVSHESAYASSRGHSLSPGRQQMASDNSDAVPSTSPRNRSLSPKSSSPHRKLEDIARSPRVRDYSEEGSDTRSHREEVLLKNLGFNSRVVEDERPSTRLKIMASSSPRSSGQINPSSPRKMLSVQRNFPEVTKLDLGLDSDRSYASQTDDLVDEGTPRRGGYGRVPRREAWERQRRKRDDIDVTNLSDPASQSKFIDILVKEINILKEKVEMIEDDTMSKSKEPSRVPSLARSPRSPRAASSYLHSEVFDDNNELFLAPRATQSANGSRERTSSCPLLETSSRSIHLSKSVSRDTTPIKHTGISVSPHRSMNTTFGGVSRNNSASNFQQGQGISLGYSGPTRSITPEIWGYDLNSTNGLDPNKQDNWKRLISCRDLTEPEVIELKQALACAIVENDILEAKLNNARHEIHDKLRHTNEVLEDCRHHLAKAQAENMGLRSKVEHERQKADGYEERIKNLEKNIFEAQQNKKQLENDLDHTSTMLSKSRIQTKPGIETFKSENSRLVSRLAKAETENEHLEEEVQSLKRNEMKSMDTMDELRDCLRKVRRERQELFEEIQALHTHQQTLKVKQIIRNYQEKGNLDENQWEEEPKSRPYFPIIDQQDSDEGIFSGSQASIDHFRSNPYPTYDDDTQDIRSRKTSETLNVSFSSSPSHTPRTSHHRYRNSDSLSPSSREIYPHRKTYQPRSRSCSPSASGYDSSRGYLINLDNSFVDQTLHEIEQDMARERQRILNRNTSPPKSRLSSYLSEENLSADPGKVKGIVSDRSSFSNNQRTQQTNMQDYRRPYSARSLSSDRFHRSCSPSRNVQKRSSSIADSPRTSLLKGSDRLRSKSRSPSCNRSSLRDNSKEANRNTVTSANLSGMRTPDRSTSPVYFPRQCHSPPTRLSPEIKDRSNSVTKKRPRHSKTQPGEIAKNLQVEFENEDKLIQSLSNSSVLRNKSWFEVQRKKIPLLTDEQRRYADQLIQKYTGNTPS